MAPKATKSDKNADNTDTPVVNSQEAVKKMIADAKKRGYITYDEMNDALPQDQMSSEQIEDVMTLLSEMGINVIDNADADSEAEDSDNDDNSNDDDTDDNDDDQTDDDTEKLETKAPADRTDDPVRMYLREMGSVELLSREGEIAIAKRIEAGRETMISGLCDSPLTFNALAAWGEMLAEEEILLRDVIDLDAMYGNDPTQETDEISSDSENDNSEDTDKEDEPEQEVVDKNKEKITKKSLDGYDDLDDEEDQENDVEEEEDDDEDDDDGATMSLATMEQALQPRVMEIFAQIGNTYKKFSKLQVLRHESNIGNTELTSTQEKRYRKLSDELIELVNNLRLNNNRIEALLEQLYHSSKRLMGLEGKMLRLAERYKVSRKSYLDNYWGRELDPDWIEEMSKEKGKGWNSFITSEKEILQNMRDQVSEI
ncbi:MAG TPA: RNA polymerase sigma factor region1.1 domain-containing protein, partial [Emcibacteraceae bacterium]|nr:RNA polymerase sigma factor region1.1 domain-containing protein [Emcibacteraceae bacterium]